MAGQKKDASTAILRRAVDRTPLHPASLGNSRPQALNPAQFAARYINREGGVIHRLLGIGGDNSPIHRTIGRTIFARFTDFNRSFGPLQRALQPQPEHKRHRKPQPEAGQDYGEYTSEDYSFSPEPIFYEPLSQYAENDYAAQSPAALPWEAPLEAMPLPVARRTEFQPANLRFLSNPERPVEQPANFERQIARSNVLQAELPFAVERQIARSPEYPVTPLTERQAEQPIPADSPEALQEAQAVEMPFNPTAERLAVPTDLPAPPPLFEAVQPAPGPGQPGNNRPFAPQLSGAEVGAGGHISEYSEAAYAPLQQPRAQPPLSRALQRTFEATAPQPGPAGTIAAFNQAADLGASPASVARHFAAPATLARYRTLKQAADKVLLGEQPAWESEHTPAFEPQPAISALNMPPVQRVSFDTAQADIALARDAAPQQAAADLQEDRRVREETRVLLEARESAIPAAQPSQVHPSQRESLQARPSQGQPLPEHETNPTASQSVQNGEVAPGSAQAGNRVQRASAAATSATQPGQSLAAGPVSRANPVVAANQGEGMVQRNTQAEPTQISRISGLSYPETTPARFDAAIPASLLGNEPLAGETIPEAGRLSGNGLHGPVKTSGWANNLAALRNNPGVEARTSVARQLSEGGEAPANSVEAWADAGPGVYYDQRRVRRSGPGPEAVAAETQERIFTLAETNLGQTSIQPQFMRGLVTEAVAPVPPVVNRSPLAATQSAPVVNGPTAANREFVSQTNSPVNRLFEAAENEGAVAAEGSLTTPSQAQPGFNTQSMSAANRADTAAANTSREAVLPGEAVVAGQLALTSPESPSRLSPDPVHFQVAEQAGIFGQPEPETALPGRVQRTIQASSLQPTALQRVFKRLDLGETENGVFAENSGFDFANLPLSYGARPGSRPHRTDQSSNQLSDQLSDPPNFGYTGQTGSYEAVQPGANFGSLPARETAIESAARPGDSSVARAYTGPDAANPAREIAGKMPTPTPRLPLTPGLANEPAQAAGESGIPGQTLSSNQHAQGVQRTVSPVSGSKAVRSNEPQYFTNSLEAAWLSPENRLLVERLPGGSGALQRLMQAPGQLQAFLELHLVGSGLNLNLPSLRNNPGLSSSVARALEDAATPNGGIDGGWLSGPVLNFVQRRQAVRQVQDSFSIPESGAAPGDVFRFEQPLTNPNNISFASPVQSEQAQTEINRLFSQPTRSEQIQHATAAQPTNSQVNANRETSARIQGKISEPGQPGIAPNFTISSDWVAQLQRRFDNISVSGLNDSTGQIMRFLNNDGASPAGFGGGQNFVMGHDFNYAVPPLLWRKVSDYAPQGGLPANPALFGSGQAAFSYTSPGEVLRAYEQGEVYPGQPDEAATSADGGVMATTRLNGSARLELPRLQQTHQLLQRIANLEKVNTSLELAHRMEAAVQVPGNGQISAQPGATPLSRSFPQAIQRQPETAARFDNRPGNSFEAAEAVTGSVNEFDKPGYTPGNPLDAAEAVTGPTSPAPLHMADVLVNLGRFLEVDPELFADEDFARPAPAPEIRTVEVRVPDHQTYATPLETAAARNGSNGPNIGQGEILQPLTIQRKASTSGPGQGTTYAPLAQPNLHNIIKTSVGRTLDHPIQRKMTDIFGTHFHDVRVHTGNEAAQATRHVGAEAFTLGSDIFFAPGRYQPESHFGQALIGHELTHVIQQSSLPSLGGGRIPETSSLGQSLEHHAIANEQLLLRHLSTTHDDHDHVSFNSDNSGRLSFNGNNSYSGGAATVERSYQPVSEQNNNPPIKPAHLRSVSGSGSEVQRAIRADYSNEPKAGASVDVNDIISNQENMDKLARKVYQIIRDELIIERERGFGPGNGKFY